MKNINLVENFLSWQGEGRDSGKKMLIVRFKHCNRHCKWCDTQVKMRVSMEAEYSFVDIQNQINESNFGLLITGGEPTFGINLNKTIDLINYIKCNILNVETNGYNLVELLEKVNKNKNVTYSLSPKLFSYEDLAFYIKLIDSIKDVEKVDIKLVYEENEYVTKFLDYLITIKFDNNRLWFMPEGKTKEELFNNSPIVFDACEKYKANFSSRNHIIFGFV
jgi:organic radical activating enzyme